MDDEGNVEIERTPNIQHVKGFVARHMSALEGSSELLKLRTEIA